MYKLAQQVQPRLFSSSQRKSLSSLGFKTKQLVEWEKTPEYKNQQTSLISPIYTKCVLDNGVEIGNCWKGFSSIFTEKARKKEGEHESAPTFTVSARDIEIFFDKNYELYLIHADEEVFVRRAGVPTFHRKFPDFLYKPTSESIMLRTNWFRSAFSDREYMAVSYKIVDVDEAPQSPETVITTGVQLICTDGFFFAI